MAEPQREWLEKDYYATLGVSETASASEITKAYRKLARKLHPDANPGDASAEDRFKEVSSAYDVIGDPDKRRSYDQVRHMGPVGGMFGGPDSGGFRGMGFEDVGDLLGGLFGRRNRRGGSPGSSQRGSDLEAQLLLDFADAVNGLETTISLNSEAVCPTCSGSGSAPGSKPKACKPCNGRGLHDDNQGMFSMSRPCAACGGRGSVITDPCDTCDGQGSVVRPRDVAVRIPAGVKAGQKLRLAGRGAPGRFGGESGDLFVKIRVTDHPIYGRSGGDLTLAVPITFAEAALGADIAVPTIDGRTVKIRIPAGTPSGKTFRVRNATAHKSSKTPKGGKNAKQGGDLLVTVDVKVPERLSDAQRSAVEALAEATVESPRSYLDRYSS